jgi:hypothetical protein
VCRKEWWSLGHKEQWAQLWMHFASRHMRNIYVPQSNNCLNQTYFWCSSICENDM